MSYCFLFLIASTTKCFSNFRTDSPKNFTTTITLPSGIEVAGAYGRVSAVDQATGTQVDALVDIYTSETAFETGLAPIEVGFNRTASVAYDRATMGTDILDLGHDALIAGLAKIGITATKSL